MKSTSIKCQLNELTEHRINENLRQNSFEQADSNLKTIFCLIKKYLQYKIAKILVIKKYLKKNSQNLN
jgi:hypothetical protein